MLKRMIVGCAAATMGLSACVVVILIMGDRPQRPPGYKVYTNNMTPSVAVYELSFISIGGMKLEQKVAAPLGVGEVFIEWPKSAWPDLVRVTSENGAVHQVALPDGKRSITITESRTGTRVFINR